MSSNLSPDCAIPKCNAAASIPLRVGLDEVGICERHADSVWNHIEWRDAKHRHENVPGMEGRDYARDEARKVRAVERRKPASMGEIYYAKQGELIKVGWSSKLYDRIYKMGPGAALLANYPGTRADEAALHRQLSPSRAKGREWYSDTPIVRDFIKQAVKKHGPPRFDTTGWTEPKTVVAGKRAGRR